MKDSTKTAGPFCRALEQKTLAWWVGGKTFFTGVIWVNQKEFYKSQAWKRARQAFIDSRMAIDGGLCQECGEELGKIVHHTIWLDDENCNDPDISLNPKRFKYECQTCHNREVDPRKAARGRCLYGPNGEILRNSEY